MVSILKTNPMTNQAYPAAVTERKASYVVRLTNDNVLIVDADDMLIHESGNVIRFFRDGFLVATFATANVLYIMPPTEMK